MEAFLVFLVNKEEDQHKTPANMQMQLTGVSIMRFISRILSPVLCNTGPLSFIWTFGCPQVLSAYPSAWACHPQLPTYMAFHRIEFT